MIRFKNLYQQQLVHSLKNDLGYTNLHQVPRLLKIVINMGVGEAVSDSKAVNSAANDLALISGQKPYITCAKKSIAGFKIRQGMKIGCKVTLRNDRMFDFLERLVLMALPRIRDFRGFSMKSFDGNGNISFGIKEHIVFPEINYDKVDKVRGMDINIGTSANDDLVAKKLLLSFNLPFYN
nr:50S ribosomal protein L5 [Rickettsia endosymbiont of Cardiosporidium cionae]